jgi:AcrR family transcriptional regulator
VTSNESDELSIAPLLGDVVERVVGHVVRAMVCSGRPAGKTGRMHSVNASADRAVAPIDGRTARREANRERVIDAYVQLLRDGVPEPSAAQLAERADVTARSVYRYLHDDDTLKHQVGERIVAGFEFPEPGAGWASASLDERVEAYLDFGLEVYDRTAPIMRVARANFATGPVVEEAVIAVREMVREQITSLFEPELGDLDDDLRDAEVMAIQVLFFFDPLEYLHLHLGRERVRGVLRHHLASALLSVGARADTASR